jgi:hypothetical protein
MRHHHIRRKTRFRQIRRRLRKCLPGDQRALERAGEHMGVRPALSMILAGDNLDARMPRALPLGDECDLPALAGKPDPEVTKLRGEVLVREQNAFHGLPARKPAPFTPARPAAFLSP